MEPGTGAKFDNLGRARAFHLSPTFGPDYAIGNSPSSRMALMRDRRAGTPDRGRYRRPAGADFWPSRFRRGCVRLRACSRRGEYRRDHIATGFRLSPEWRGRGRGRERSQKVGAGGTAASASLLGNQHLRHLGATWIVGIDHVTARPAEREAAQQLVICLLYTSDAADE